MFLDLIFVIVHMMFLDLIVAIVHIQLVGLISCLVRIGFTGGGEAPFNLIVGLAQIGLLDLKLQVVHNRSLDLICFIVQTSFVDFIKSLVHTSLLYLTPGHSS